MLPAFTMLLITTDMRTGLAYAVTPKPVVQGAVKTMLPRLLTFTGPVGIALNATIAAAALYQSRDTWMPWVRGTFGSAGETAGEVAGASSCVNAVSWYPGRSPASDDPALAENYTVQTEFSCGTGSLIWSGVGQTFTTVCRLNSGAGTTTNTASIGTSEISGVGWQLGVRNTGLYTGKVTGCPANSTVIEVVVTKTTSCGSYSCSGNGLRFSNGYTKDESRIESTVNCKRPDGSTFSHTVSSRGIDSNDFVVPACQSITPDARPESLTTRGGFDGATGALPLIGTTTIPTTSTEYPFCFDVTQPSCRLEIKVDGSPCAVGAPLCVDWISTDPNRTTCYWGPYLVPKEQCGAMEGAYRDGGTELTGDADVDLKPGTTTSPTPAPSPAPGTNPSPAPSSAPSSAPAATPGRVINPDGSETESSTSVQPDGSTRTVERTQTQDGATTTTTRTTAPDGTTTTTTTTTPPFGAGALAEPAAGDTSGEGCLSRNFSWNPVSWVFAPVKCALQWAFVPSQSSADQINALRAEAGARPPVSIGTWAAGAVPAFGDGFGAATSCTALPDFDPAQLGRARLPCKPDFALYDVGFVLVQLFLVAVTGVYVWGMAQRALQASGGEVV
jgi:hypothetical protein